MATEWEFISCMYSQILFHPERQLIQILWAVVYHIVC